MIEIKNYIGGELVNSIQNEKIDVYDPSIGEVFAHAPNSTASDIESAVKAAELAFPSWSNMPHEKRSKILIKIASLIDDNLDLLAEAEAQDNGKPIHLAKSMDIPRAASNFYFFATALMHFASESHDVPNNSINYTLRQPIGIVGCISPWNLPLYLFTWKIAPALATGNCVIAKPSEITPYTAFLLSKICIEAGLPAGVLNIVHGLGGTTGKAIVEHPKIKAISFTGGTKTGEWIAQTAAPKFKKLSLELGGKNPCLIFDDCNYDQMLETVVRSSFTNQGQICLCSSRIYIQKSIYQKFKLDFIQKVKALKVGSPTDPESNLGTIVSKDHYHKILSYIALAKEERGILLTGGNSVHLEGKQKKGWYIEPTVFENLSISCRTNQEEIFGPVVTITPFETEEDALEMANASIYGLASTIWTNDLSRAHRLGQKINTGIVWVNCWLMRDLRTPFGGMNASGIGREGGWEALRFFTEAKNICIKYGQ
jgi:aminomuconate-semialdehyde/2-hydroxymuconate-6-semialdehyde dehydrogenase